MKKIFHSVAIVTGFPARDVSNLTDKINVYVFVMVTIAPGEQTFEIINICVVALT
jgi:hypothetical protein